MDYISIHSDVIDKLLSLLAYFHNDIHLKQECEVKLLTDDRAECKPYKPTLQLK